MLKRFASLVALLLSFAGHAFANTAHQWSVVDNFHGPYRNVRVIKQPDGRRVLFAVNEAGQVQSVKEWRASGGFWFSAESLGAPGGYTAGPAIPVLDAAGRINLFAVSPNNDQLFVKTQSIANGGWNNWMPLNGATSVHAFTAALNESTGEMEVFYISNGQLKRMRELCGGCVYGAPQAMAGENLELSIAVERDAMGRLQVFVHNTAAGLFSARQRSAGSAEYDLLDHRESTITEIQDIETTRLSDGRIGVFLLHGPSRSLSLRVQTGAGADDFLAPLSLWGWALQNGIAATTTSDGRLSAFALGGDSVVYNTSAPNADPLNGLWSNWPSTNTVASSITVIPRGTKVDIFAIGLDGSLMQGRE